MKVRIEREGQEVLEYDSVAYVNIEGTTEHPHLDVIFNVMNGTDVDNFRIEELSRVVIS
jgi:hypothetical protein